jgi:hypothetical protein
MKYSVNHRTISIIIFTMVMLILLSFNRTAKTVISDDCSISNSVFQHGEKLVYKLYYNWGLIWIPAGEVIFTVKESDHTYEMKAIGKTYKSYESIFKVNDYFYSKVDKKTLFPKNFVRIVEEGNYRLYDSISFDQARNIAVSYHGKTKESAKPQIHVVNQCMQDMVSNIYYMRNFHTDDMNKGDKFAVKMFFDKEVFPINVRYDGKEKKDIKELGKFNTIRIIPDLVEGNVFKKGDYMKLWVSDDKNKIPLLIESPVSVGSLKAVLKSHSGLRYTLDSKIKE